jgi:hypothetical protein
MRFVQVYLGLPLAMIVVSAVFLPIYHRLHVFTAYEYLEYRFDWACSLPWRAAFPCSTWHGVGHNDLRTGAGSKHNPSLVTHGDRPRHRSDHRDVHRAWRNTRGESHAKTADDGDVAVERTSELDGLWKRYAFRQLQRNDNDGQQHPAE